MSSSIIEQYKYEKQKIPDESVIIKGGFPVLEKSLNENLIIPIGLFYKLSVNMYDNYVRDVQSMGVLEDSLFDKLYDTVSVKPIIIKQTLKPKHSIITRKTIKIENNLRIK